MLADLRELYQEVILDHGKNPRNFGHPPAANRSAEGYNPFCGDQVQVHLTLDAEERIEDVAFEGKGCAISVASASMMTEVVKGRTRAEAGSPVRGFSPHVHRRKFRYRVGNRPR